MKPWNVDHMTKYSQGFKEVRKKPIIVLACQMHIPGGFEVTTPEGVVYGKSGDYLMIGVAGELYPCRKDIFEQSYEAAE
jgi:hypothetical protein